MPKDTPLRVIDTRRPVEKVDAGNVAPSEQVTTHSNLSGLTNHDHTQYYLKTEFATTSIGTATAGSPVALNSAGDVDLSMMPGVSGIVTCTDAVLHIANGVIVAIIYAVGAKPSSSMSTMVLGPLMGAVYDSSVYKEARDVP